MVKRTEISYTCDSCGKDIAEGKDRFVVHGVQYDFDLCTECHNIMRFNSGSQAKNASLHACDDCTFVAKSAGGLTLHRNKAHPS